MSNLLKSKFLLGVMVVATMLVAVGGFSPKTASADCTITATLRVGSRGDQVACLQAVVGVNADGKFGPMTKTAVMAWQAGKGLVADGVFGAKSRAAFAALGGSVSTSFAPAGCTSASGYSPTLGLAGGACYAVSSSSLPTGCLPGYLFNPSTGLSCASGGTVVVVPTTGVVTVALASDNPAAGTLLIDDTTGVMQNAAPVAKFVFSNGTGAEVKVNTVKLTRTGIAADGDISNLFLYEGTTKLAELSSVSTKVFSFNNSAGLFTIGANSSKAIWVGINMAVATSGPTSVGFKIASAADVVLSNGTTASGSFPISGNEFATAFITDLGYINLTSTATYPATLDPKPEAQELWRFTATANSQKMQLKRIVLTLVGTVSPGDIQDLTLSVGGVQVGATAQLGADNKVTFDLSGAPYTLLSGQNKVFVLNGKVVKGTGRAFKFTIRSTADFVSTDTNYSADTVPLNASAALTVVDPDSAGDGTNINNGSLTVSRSASSPAGNVASGALDTPLARFDYRANGEDIKVSYLRVKVNNSQNVTMNDGKLYFNGSQVGTTDDSVADAVTADTVTDASTVLYSLGNTVIIPAGTTGVFEYRANIEQDTGTDLTADGTIIVYLVAGVSGDAIGQTSLTSLTPSASTSQTVTIKSGVLSAAKNTSVADSTTVNPTGVVGATNVLVGSMVITAGAGEAVNITQLVVGDDNGDTTSDFGTNFQNLTLRHGSSTSTPIATPQGTLSATEGADYTFSLSPSVTVAAGAQYVVDIYADILTGASEYAAATTGLEFVSASATGVNTSADASYSTLQNLQSLVISASGSLVITVNASTPAAAQLVMGETGQTLAILDFAAGSAEDVDVSVIIVTDTSSFAGSLSNIKLYAQGVTEPIGTVASFSAESNGTATFNLASNWTILRNTTKTLTIKADVNSYGSAVSGGAHVINVAAAGNITTRGSKSGVAIAETVTVGTISHKVYRTKVVVDKGGSSPSGTAVVSATSDVLEFTVVANSAYDAVVNVVALTISGSVDMTSTGNAVLYKSTDLSTALATEAYVTAAAASGNTVDFVVASAASLNGIPVGATVRIQDLTDSSYDTTKVTAIDGVTMTVSPAVTDIDATDIVYYRPLQPGTGKLFFGAQTTLTADLATGAASIAVTSADGFSTGDVVTFAGYNSTNVLCTGSGTLTSIAATLLTGTMTIDCATGTDTIVYNQLSTAGNSANAILNSQNGVAVAYTGLVNTTGQVVSAGASATTFVVKGDTTGATTTETLRVDVAAVGDLNWDDKTSFGVTTVTKNLPVTGGTLTY